jgi:hypothetical protein
LVKVNCLWAINKNCSQGMKLLESQFSLRRLTNGPKDKFFFNCKYSRIFYTSRNLRRNFDTLVKVNCLWAINKNCSQGMKLLESQFSPRRLTNGPKDEFFFNYKYSRIFFTSRTLRCNFNFDTLVKVNCLWAINKNCSQGMKLLESQFSLRKLTNGP